MVRDVDEAVGFYVDLLRFELVSRMGPPFAIVARDGLELWLSGPESSAGRPMPDGRAPEPGGWNQLMILVDDVPEALARLDEQGTTRRNDPISGPGGTQMVIEDPPGNPHRALHSSRVGTDGGGVSL